MIIIKLTQASIVLIVVATTKTSLAIHAMCLWKLGKTIIMQN